MTSAPRKPVTITEVNHEVEPDEQTTERARPIPSRTGAAADALLDDAAGKPRSETEAALDRATGTDRSASDS